MNQGLLGYLNFSTGKPDPRVQTAFFNAWQSVSSDSAPWLALHKQFTKELTALHTAGSAAFSDIAQATAVLNLGLLKLPEAYRLHHTDLLGHLSEAELFQPGFLMRALEAVLSQHGPWEDSDRIVKAAIKRLNDYVGHRPIAVLESRPEGEPYDHEKICPIPLFIRGAGAVPGRYGALVAKALEVIRATRPGLLTDAHFDVEHLDELTLDPRAYDHNHPADRRPNYRFGEWDPHHIDTRGFFRRFVVRQITLDGLLDRVRNAPAEAYDDMLMEAATVLTGTMLMASSLSGAGPDTHDSSSTLGTIMPPIARLRDAFYGEHLAVVTGSHGQRLREEAKLARQPFGGARQQINQYLALNQAAQLQQRRLAVLIAELGYPEAARRHAARVPVASLRLLAEIHIHITTCQVLANQGKHGEAADHLAGAEAIMHRAIGAGAMVDPWNILGFQGLYPLFAAREDSVGDRRIGELVQVIDTILTQYAHLRAEAAAAGDKALGGRLARKMSSLAEWWDQFATTTVNDVPHVVGRESAAAANHVATALALWHQRGEAPADLAFWRQHLDGFRTAKSFALVVDELLRKNDHRAAMGLLVNWLSQAPQVPLQDGEHSFHLLSLRWMISVDQHAEAGQLIPKFIDHLEANADDYWQVPRLPQTVDGQEEQLPMPREHEEDALFGAAYEDMTFKDSTDDGNEGEVLGFEPRQEFDLDHQSSDLQARLHWFSTLTRLWHIGSHRLSDGPTGQTTGANREIVAAWLGTAQRNYQDLLTLMDTLQDKAIPAPSGSYESLVEFDRRNAVKQQLLNMVIGTCLDSALAVGAMRGTVDAGESAAAEGQPAKRSPPWEPSLLKLEQAMWRGDAAAARAVLPLFLEHFQHEPLLITPLHHGGKARLILRAGIAQTLLRALAANLPRLGLLRETFGVLRMARTMESEQKLEGPRQTDFDRLYRIACQASVEAVVEAVNADEELSHGQRVQFLGRLIEPYLNLWAEYSRTVRLSVLETLTSDGDWQALKAFIDKYGAGLFHARFMTLGNLRGILDRGVAAWFTYLQDNPDPQNPVPLIDDLDRGIPVQEAARHLEMVLQAVVENYEEYKDYNTTTAQSDYGENLHMLLDFLRLKVAYLRQAWAMLPLTLVHEALAKHTGEGAAMWERQVERLTAKEAGNYLVRLGELERQHGMRLRTVGDRVRERFVMPLALDRACALIEPAYDEARKGAMHQALDQLEDGLQPYLNSPTGAGLDVPMWLQRLESELQRVKLRRTAVANLAENLLQVPRITLPLPLLEAQLEDWPR